MITNAQLAYVVARANLAPSVHNIQPTRWRRRSETAIEVGVDLSVGLAVGDPTGRDAGLSCGAAVEATLLALSEIGLSAEVVDHWNLDDRTQWPGHRMAATLQLVKGEGTAPLLAQLDKRATWRGTFSDDTPQLFGWTPRDTTLVMDRPTRAWLAAQNDVASLEIMRGKLFRRELLAWMRLSPRHRRYAYDGLSRDAMQMSGAEANGARLALGPLWGVLDRIGLTASLTAEAQATLTAPIIACFHAPTGQSPVTTGRSYLRLCLQAAQLGFAGWPMAALTDHGPSYDAIVRRLAVDPDRTIVQMIRFGVPTGPLPTRARRPVDELLL